jgi:hypothetical protein
VTSGRLARRRSLGDDAVMMQSACERDRRRSWCFPAGALLLVSVLLLPLGVARATGAVRSVRVSRCPAPNAEVVQAIHGRYVYEAWIGCDHSIGFARSADGGRTFGRSRSVPGSSHRRGLHAWDPAVAVAADGTLYLSYMVASLVHTPNGLVREMRPAVAVSHDRGRSFDRVSRLPIPIPQTVRGNWGDREFVAVGPDGTVYVTWDYGPRADEVKIVCLRSGSCVFTAGDFNAVIQRSSDGGRTWTRLTSISPGFPLGGVYSAPIVAQRNGTLDVLYWQHPTNPKTLSVSPGREYFTRSTDRGATWSRPVPVDPRAGRIGLREWWIDGSLAVDRVGTLYVSWDTQRSSRDTAWLAWSTDGGAHWSPPLRVASSRAEHLTEVAAAGRHDVYVAWQTVVSGKGYATFARRLSVGKGWTAPAARVSPAYGNPRIWPGDTFGLSTKNGSALLSWGGATNGRAASEIYSSQVTLPSRRTG